MSAPRPTGHWLDIGPIGQIAPGNARTLPVRGGEEIAIFHTLDNQFYALVNRCPHKQGPLSQGIVHGHVVTCPLHNWNISLTTGQALGEDRGCVPTIPIRVDAGRLYVLREAVIGARAALAAAQGTAAPDAIATAEAAHEQTAIEDDRAKQAAADRAGAGRLGEAA